MPENEDNDTKPVDDAGTGTMTVTDDMLPTPTPTPAGFDPSTLDPIVNGVPTGLFPDCCAVGNETGYFCTGTLIAPNLVITARHCMGRNPAPQTSHIRQVFLKGSDVRFPMQGETIRVINQFRNPDADICLLVLERSSTVKPRPIWRGPVSTNDHIRLVGFGNVDLQGTVGFGIKRMAEGVELTSVDCTGAQDSSTLGCVPRIELVAGKRLLAKDTCKGDSGGPLYIEDRPTGQYFLLGATSRATRDARTTCGDGGIYTRVDRFIDWIERTSGINLPHA